MSQQEQAQQLQQWALIQEICGKSTKLCFTKCMGTPGNSLSRSEKNCLTQCARTQVAATAFLAQVLEQAAQQQR